MPIQHAVLALLAEGPSYGYQLKASFEQTIGPQWGQLNIGHLYQVLDRLLRDGLATARVVPQTDRPDRNVYEITQEGVDELEQWLAEPASRQSGHRDDFFLKLMAASRRSAEDVRVVVRTQRRAQLAELRALTELRAAQADDPLVTLLVDAAVEHVQAGLRFADIAEARADELTRSVERQAVAGAVAAAVPNEPALGGTERAG